MLDKLITCDDMIRLESNGYLRGSNLFGNEMPVRQVSLSLLFLIDRLPVTNARYKFHGSGDIQTEDIEQFWLGFYPVT